MTKKPNPKTPAMKQTPAALRKTLLEHFQTLKVPLTDQQLDAALCRAREAFAKFVLMAVQESLATDCLDQLEEELIELDLHRYCRPALKKLHLAAAG